MSRYVLVFKEYGKKNWKGIGECKFPLFLGHVEWLVNCDKTAVKRVQEIAEVYRVYQNKTWTLKALSSIIAYTRYHIYETQYPYTPTGDVRVRVRIAYNDFDTSRSQYTKRRKYE